MKPKWGKILIATVGMTAPLVVAFGMGRPEAGVVASFGALALSGEGDAPGFRASLRSYLFALLAGFGAFVLGGWLSRVGLATLWVLPPLFLAVSLLGGMGRTLARYTTMFLVFLTIALSLGSPPVGFASSALFLLGALATLVLAVLLWPLRKREFDQEKARQKSYSLRQEWAHGSKGLGTLGGWSYPLRLTASAAAAAVLIALIPISHPYWILLTTLVVVQRKADQVPARMLERGLGTVVGVGVLGLLALVVPGVPASILFVLVLSGLRVSLRESHYLLYAAAMTALVVVLIDWGAALSLETVLDRLVATLLGCAVSWVFGYGIEKGWLGGRKNGP